MYFGNLSLIADPLSGVPAAAKRHPEKKKKKITRLINFTDQPETEDEDDDGKDGGPSGQYTRVPRTVQSVVRCSSGNGAPPLGTSLSGWLLPNIRGESVGCCWYPFDIRYTVSAPFVC